VALPDQRLYRISSFTGSAALPDLRLYRISGFTGSAALPDQRLYRISGFTGSAALPNQRLYRICLVQISSIDCHRHLRALPFVQLGQFQVPLLTLLFDNLGSVS
jgi:hypothetical protein